MNRFNQINVILAFSSCLAFSSQAVELKAADNSTLTQLCMTAASGNRAAMHNAIKESAYSKQFIAKNVRCNSSDVISFVQQYGRNVDGIMKSLEIHGTSVSINDLAKLSRQYR